MRSISNLFRKSPEVLRPLMAKGIVYPNKPVPAHIMKPEYALNGIVPSAGDDIVTHGAEAIERMRKAGRVARKALEFALALAKPGVSTDYIDSLTFDEIIRHNAYPSPINYSNFPKSICTSVNEVVCHGIPDSRVLQEGDILSIDVSVYMNGYHGDNCGTVIVGKGDEVARSLVETNIDVLDMAIAKCVAGACLSEVGNTIENEANRRGFAVVSQFCGHGVGHLMHMPPFVVHHRNNHEVELKPGMVFTIEPILIEGKDRLVVWDDKWTAATKDNSRGSQFEHQILITESGPPEILTCLE